MERQLELLEHRAVDVRVQAAKRLFYLIQGERQNVYARCRII